MDDSVVRDAHVEAPELVGGVLHRGLGFGRVAEVDPDDDRPASERLDPRRVSAAAPRWSSAMSAPRRASAKRHRPADPATGSRHDRRLSGQKGRVRLRHHLARLDRHTHAVPWPERDSRRELDRVAGDEP